VKDFFAAFVGFGTIIVSLGFMGWLGFESYAYYKPKYTAVDNKTFHQSQQYTDGMANKLADYEVAYNQATSPQAKATIRSIIVEQYENFDETTLPPDLRSFLDQMKGYQQ
jgi:hypothetical protein